MHWNDAFSDWKFFARARYWYWKIAQWSARSIQMHSSQALKMISRQENSFISNIHKFIFIFYKKYLCLWEYRWLKYLQLLLEYLEQKYKNWYAYKILTALIFYSKNLNENALYFPLFAFSNKMKCVSSLKTNSAIASPKIWHDYSSRTCFKNISPESSRIRVCASTGLCLQNKSTAWRTSSIMVHFPYSPPWSWIIISKHGSFTRSIFVFLPWLLSCAVRSLTVAVSKLPSKSFRSLFLINCANVPCALPQIP